MGSTAYDLKKGLKRVRNGEASHGTADWALANNELLVKCIASASFKRCALRFGYSRDGGAYAVGVYSGEDYWTDYIRPAEDIDTYLQDLLQSFEEYTPEAPETLKPQRTRRR